MTRVEAVSSIARLPSQAPMLLPVAFVWTALLVWCAVPASGASPAPGWSIGSVAEPTNFNDADASDTVEELAVHATGGTYELQATRFAVTTGPIAWNASASELEKALEELPGVGAGSVSVTGGPGDATGSMPYIVTWTGTLSGTSPGELEVIENHLSNGVAEGTVARELIHDGATKDRYLLTVTNVGSRTSEGEVIIADKLPPGLVPVSMEIDEPQSGKEGECSVSEMKCEYGEPVQAAHQLVATVDVALPASSVSGEVINEATVSGGGGREVSTSESTLTNAGTAHFGIARFAFEAVGLDGNTDMQAGDHPFGVTTTIDLNTQLVKGIEVYGVTQEVKNVTVDLPLGLAGDPLAAEQCPEVDLTDTEGAIGGGNFRTACPVGSRVGTVRLLANGGLASEAFPLYNIVPERGYPAELGFNGGLDQPIILYASVIPTASGYRLRVGTPGAIRAEDVEGLSVTIFGDPGEHDGGRNTSAFITNPTRCTTGPVSVTTEVTSWEGGLATAESTAYPQVAGCDLLQGAAAFDPSIDIEPETTQADTPSGYEVDLTLPQAPDMFGVLATPELKNATVTLPAGVSISPSAASGPDALEGCTEAQIDLLGTELGAGHPGGNGSPYDDGLTHASPGHCPENSRIGEVELKTPLLEEPLHGHLYLAQPHCGGVDQPECIEAAAEEGRVFGLYLEMAGSGVIVKLAGSVEAGGYGAHSLDTGLAPGQLRTRFDNNPQLPFEELKLTFTGGQRAPLQNPQSCGTSTTTSELEPWSAPESGPNATPSSAFAVTGCANPMRFKPGFTAGTLTPIGGGYSPVTLQVTRQDGEQDFAGVSVTTPAGLEGMLSKVALCGEPQAALGTCSSASQIGTATVASGAGTQPLWLSGWVYLTGPYKGAPFGLSIVVPAKAGPFNLGNVVVRSTISVNSDTAALTVTSDPLPQSIDGVPFRLKTINVEVNRPEFMFNPTNCDSQSISATISAAQGASAAVSSPFAVIGCKNLHFKPSFTASTQGKTSKADGASLVVKVAQKPGEANIHRVDLQLPLSLPSRLTTLQKACTEAQFDTNPAGCPSGSVIGTAKAVTPVLNVPLTGPAYLVSHGGAAFPDVEFVLQGQGVTIVLDGKTQIKKGITYSHFETVPDAPISSFETNLPEGPHSALAANGNLCSQKLVMPTTIAGQNGAQIKQSTSIAVTGCGKPSIKITKAKVKGNTVLVTLTTSQPGTVTVSGSGLKTVRETLGAGAHHLKVSLTKNGTTARKHHKKTKLRASVKDSNGSSSKTKTIKL